MFLVIAGAAPAKGLRKGGMCPSSGTGDVMLKSKIPVDEVVGDSTLLPGVGAMCRNGLVGNGLKGGIGTGKGDTLKGLRDWETDAESEGRCTSEEGQVWKGIGGGGLNGGAPG